MIPLFDHQAGEEVLVGYASRALDGSDPKYLFPSCEKGFYKSHLVFHLARVRGQRAGVVVEGFFDCMRVNQAGFPAVALMGCEISERQAELLCTAFERLVVFLDGDAAGKAGTERALIEIGKRGRYVRAVCVPEGTQPDALADEDITRLLAHHAAGLTTERRAS